MSSVLMLRITAGPSAGRALHVDSSLVLGRGDADVVKIGNTVVAVEVGRGTPPLPEEAGEPFGQPTGPPPAPLAEGFCPECGAAVPSSARFCAYCGVSLTRASAPRSQRARTRGANRDAIAGQTVHESFRRRLVR